MPHCSTSSSSSYHCLSILKPPTPLSAAPALALSSCSSLLFSASAAQILILDLNILTQIDYFSAVPTAGSVKSLALSADSRTAFTAHQDGRIRVWRRSSRSGRHRLAATLPTAADRLRRLPIPANYVTVRRHRRRLWIEHADAVSALAAGPGLLYSASWDKTLKIWRADGSLRCVESVPAHDDAVNAVAVSSDGTVYTGSADGRVRAWRPAPAAKDGGRRRRHQLVATMEGHRSAVNALAVSCDGAALYSGSGDRSILVWERDEAAGHVALAGELRGHTGAVLCLAVAGDVLFSGSGDRTVRVWRRQRGVWCCVGVVEGHVSGVRSLVAGRVRSGADSGSVSVSGSDSEGEEEYRVCSGSLDGEVRIWRVRVGAEDGCDA